MATIILTGGGTAGHVMPNIALLPYLRKNFDKIYYLGGNGIEKDLAEKNQIRYFETSVVKFDRGNLFANFKIPVLLYRGIREAENLFASICPDVVFSKGGYASLPACFAARNKHVPVVCHESDYSFGLANKITARFADKVLTSFPETKGGTYVGNPIRIDFLRSQPNAPIPDFFTAFDKNKKTVLICGGSLGSHAINEAVYKSLPSLREHFNVIHISGGTGDFSIRGKNYRQIGYADNFPFLLQKSDYVVCRSGSNTLFEVASLGKPCLTVPLPRGASRGDQILNARSFERQGLCKVLLQEKLNENTLLSELLGLETFHPKKLDVFRANEKISNILAAYS